MATILITHEVDDLKHWLTSPKREEFFGPLGFTARTFVSPDNAERVGLIVEGPGLAELQEALTSPLAAEAMKYDGVRPDTIAMYVEPEVL